MKEGTYWLSLATPSPSSSCSDPAALYCAVLIITGVVFVSCSCSLWGSGSLLLLLLLLLLWSLPWSIVIFAAVVMVLIWWWLWWYL